MNAPLDPIAHALPCDQVTSLGELFLASRAAHGSRPALWVEGRSLTYAELYRAAAELAGAIQAARGRDAVHHDAQCGLLVNRTPTAYTGVLASLMVGSAYVPLNPNFPCDRLRDILSASAIDTIVVDHRSVEAAAQLLERCPRTLTVILPDTPEPEAWFARAPAHRYITQADIERAGIAAAPARAPAADHGAYLLFTSGSTGTPKGVLISSCQRVGLCPRRHPALSPRSGRSVQPVIRFLV